MTYTYTDATGATHTRVISVPAYEVPVSLIKSVPATYSAESARYVAGAYRRVELSCAFCACGQNHYVSESNYPLIMRG